MTAQRRPRRRKVRDWERAQVVITGLLDEWDPLGLIGDGAPAGEYRPEADALERLVRAGEPVRGRDVRRVFVDLVGLKGEAIPARQCRITARRIRRAVHALP
jgi:hypothetical protein